MLIVKSISFLPGHKNTWRLGNHLTGDSENILPLKKQNKENTCVHILDTHLKSIGRNNEGEGP